MSSVITGVAPVSINISKPVVLNLFFQWWTPPMKYFFSKVLPNQYFIMYFWVKKKMQNTLLNLSNKLHLLNYLEKKDIKIVKDLLKEK